MSFTCEDHATISFIGLTYTLDIFSDYLVILTSWRNGPLWMSGFVMFIISMCLRMVNECEYCIGDGLDSCGEALCIYCFLGPLLFPFILVAKVLRVVLIPFDLFLSIGFYSTPNVTECSSILAKMTWTKEEKEYYDKMNLPMKYYNFVTSLFGGGRWIIISLDYVEHKFHKNLGYSIMAEEIFENIGGLMMSISVFVENDGPGSKSRIDEAIAISSIILAVISFFIETGRYLGSLKTWGETA